MSMCCNSDTSEKSQSKLSASSNASKMHSEESSEPTVESSAVSSSCTPNGSRSTTSDCSSGSSEAFGERLKSWLRRKAINDGRYDHFKNLELESFPQGYPRIAACMISDINTSLYRGFRWERNRLLLHHQDRIAELSGQLGGLDRADEASQPYRLYSRRDDEEQPPAQRTYLLRQLARELKEYDDLLVREHAIATMPKPTKHDHRSLFNWFYNNKPVVWDEYQHLYQQDDFILLGNQQDGWLRSFEEKILAFGRLFTKKPLVSKKHRSKTTTDVHIHYSSNYRIGLIAKLTVTFASTALLMLPIVLLCVLHTTRGIKLFILLLFVFAFAMALSMMTNAKRHEVFTAVAAYGAVLVVFLANLPGYS